MDLTLWKKKWDINHDAFLELLDILTPVNVLPRSFLKDINSEKDVLDVARLTASKQGEILFRNNVGAFYNDRKQFIRYGLANDSERINKVIKSGDLIGIRPVLITQDHVGATIGQFCSKEIKKPNWKYSDSEREKAQKKWMNLIISLGGHAEFVTTQADSITVNAAAS